MSNEKKNLINEEELDKVAGGAAFCSDDYRVTNSMPTDIFGTEAKKPVGTQDTIPTAAAAKGKAL